MGVGRNRMRVWLRAVWGASPRLAAGGGGLGRCRRCWWWCANGLGRSDMLGLFFFPPAPLRAQIS